MMNHQDLVKLDQFFGMNFTRRQDKQTYYILIQHWKKLIIQKKKKGEREDLKMKKREKT